MLVSLMVKEGKNISTQDQIQTKTTVDPTRFFFFFAGTDKEPKTFILMTVTKTLLEIRFLQCRLTKFLLFVTKRTCGRKTKISTDHISQTKGFRIQEKRICEQLYFSSDCCHSKLNNRCFWARWRGKILSRQRAQTSFFG